MMKINAYCRVGRKYQTMTQEERKQEIKNHWNNKIGAWRKC